MSNRLVIEIDDDSNYYALLNFFKDITFSEKLYPAPDTDILAGIGSMMYYARKKVIHIESRIRQNIKETAESVSKGADPEIPKTKPKTLSEYRLELQKKININYTGNFLDTRFNFKEVQYLFAAMAKLFRLMNADTLEKVPDDAIDVVGYLELFWESFQSRNNIPVVIRKELYR